MSKSETAIKQNDIWGYIQQAIAQHPFITSAFACALSLLLFREGNKNELSPLSLFSMLIVLGIFMFITFFLYMKDTLTKNQQYMFFSGSMLLGITFTLISANVTNNIISIFIMALLLCSALTLFWYKNKSLTTGKIASIIIILGFALRLLYILYTSIYERQHDNGEFGTGYGHLAYIEFFWDNLFSLPTEDIRNLNQFYHPPLHHFLAGAFLNLFKCFGFSDINQIGEYIQYLTMFYSCCCMVITYKILRFLNLKGWAVISGLSIVTFHPTFIILGGSINNDMLCTTFMMAAVLNTLYYYKNPTLLNIIKIAICVGCAMMSKLSGWMVAPAIAIIFIVVLICNKEKWLSIIKQWAVFGVICVPLALWWEIRNLITHQVPITYVWQVNPDIAMNVSKSHTAFERLFDFSAFQFQSVYDQYEWYGCPYYEYNPTIGLFKTSLFDEAQYTAKLDFLATLLFWSNILLAIFAIIAMVYIFIKRTDFKDIITKLFLFTLYIVPVVSYYIFCFGYPFTCTMNIRYAVMTIVVGAIFISMALQTFTKNISDNKASKYLALSGYSLVAIFCTLAIITYIMIGCIPAIYDGIMH